MGAIKVEVFWLSMIHNLAWGRVSVEKWLVHHTVVANVVVDMAWDDMVSREAHWDILLFFSYSNSKIKKLIYRNSVNRKENVKEYI